MPFVPYNFTVMADSGVKEGGSVDSPRASVKFKVAWVDRINFVNFVCGTTTGGPGGVIRTKPAAYPPSPNMYATREFEIEPLGKLMTVNGWVSYPFAVVTINFAVPDYGLDNGTGDPSGVPWTTTTFDVSGEFLTLPDSAYTFPGGTPVGAPVGRVIPQVGITFKRHWLPYLPVLEMLSLIGKVNNAAFSVGNFNCPTETLMFLGGPNTRQADTSTDPSQEVEYKFLYRPINWNQFMKPDGTGFAYLTDAGGNKVYQLGDFTILP